MRKNSLLNSFRVQRLLGQGFGFLIDLLFPVSCLGCGEENIWLCRPCFKNLPVSPARHCPFCGQHTSFGQNCSDCRPKHSLDGAMSFIPYANPGIQKLIHAWKYQSVKNLTPTLADFVSLGLDSIIQKLRAQSRALEQGLSQIKLAVWPALPTLILSSQTTLVSVPLAPRRLKSRGFNQAEELARCLANSRNYNFSQLITRTRHTAPQATLSGSDRLTNIKDAFELVPGHLSLVGRNFLIVDDVITTGSTCEAMARVLKKHGAASVWALTVAFGHPL